MNDNLKSCIHLIYRLYNEHEPVYINDIKLKDTKQKTMPDIEKIRQQGF